MPTRNLELDPAIITFAERLPYTVGTTTTTANNYVVTYDATNASAIAPTLEGDTVVSFNGAYEREKSGSPCKGCPLKQNCATPEVNRAPFSDYKGIPYYVPEKEEFLSIPLDLSKYLDLRYSHKNRFFTVVFSLPTYTLLNYRYYMDTVLASLGLTYSRGSKTTNRYPGHPVADRICKDCAHYHACTNGSIPTIRDTLEKSWIPSCIKTVGTVLKYTATRVESTRPLVYPKLVWDFNITDWESSLYIPATKDAELDLCFKGQHEKLLALDKFLFTNYLRPGRRKA